jgi:hypothetical protein
VLAASQPVAHFIARPVAPRLLGVCDVPVRPAVTQARFADGDGEGGRSALRSALKQLRLRAGRIKDAGMCESYLALAPHCQLMDLAMSGRFNSAKAASDLRDQLTLIVETLALDVPEPGRHPMQHRPERAE